MPSTLPAKHCAEERSEMIAPSIMGNKGQFTLCDSKACMLAVASLVGLAPQGSSLGSALERRPAQPCRVLCIGLGGGTLPLFLAHHFPGMVIDVVEIDPVVIAAAQGAMGFPKHRSEDLSARLTKR